MSPPPPSLFWWLLAAAFSPVLLDLLVHGTRQPWAGYCLVFLPLFALELRRAPEGVRRPTLGVWVLAAALVIELLLVGGGLTRAARPAVALAALGMAWREGRPGPRAVALLLWFVPVPSGLVSLSSPELETLWGQAASGLAQLFGSPLAFVTPHGDPTLLAAGGPLRLLPSDGGLPLAALLSGLAWWAGLRRGARIATTLLAAAVCAALSAPIQILAIALVASLAGGEGAARLALDVAPWATVTAVGLWLAGRAGDASPGPDGEPLSSPPR